MEFVGKALQTVESVFDGMAERIVECEFIVPDYYQDILRVIKTEAVPRIKNTVITQDKLCVDGLVEFRIFYVSDGGEAVKCIAYACDYNLDFDIKDIPSDAYIKVRPSLQNTVCRVLNSRKLSPKTQLVMGAKIYASKDNPVMTSEEAEDFETMCVNVNVFNVVAHTVKPLLISDDIELKGTSAEHLLKNDVRIEVDDIKTINNKIIVRGNAIVKTLYASENDEISNNIEEIPFNHIMEIDNANDDCECEVKYYISDCMCILKDGENGDGKSISVDIEAKGAARIFKNVENTIVCDAYSRSKECSLNRKVLNYEVLQSKINERTTDRIILEAAEDVNRIIDITSVPTIVQVSVSENNINIEGNIDISAVFLNNDNQVMSIGKNAPFRKAIPVKDTRARLRLEPEIDIAAIDSNISGNRIELAIDTVLTGLLFEGGSIEAVTSCEIRDEIKNTDVKVPAITLYFAKNGEYIWDIAKNYNSSVSEINELNNISAEVLTEDTMLIIPRK